MLPEPLQRRRRPPIGGFHSNLLGARLLVLDSAGAGWVGTVSTVSEGGLTLDEAPDRCERVAAEDVQRLWILRPSEQLLELCAAGRSVRVLLADGGWVAGRILEQLGFGGFLVLSRSGVSEVAWIDVQRLEPMSEEEVEP